MGLGIWKRPSSGERYVYAGENDEYEDKARRKLIGDFGSFYSPPLLDNSKLPTGYLMALRAQKAAADEKYLQQQQKPN